MERQTKILCMAFAVTAAFVGILRVLHHLLVGGVDSIDCAITFFAALVWGLVVFEETGR